MAKQTWLPIAKWAQIKNSTAVHYHAWVEVEGRLVLACKNMPDAEPALVRSGREKHRCGNCMRLVQPKYQPKWLLFNQGRQCFKLPKVDCKHGAPMGRSCWPRTNGGFGEFDPTAVDHFKLPARCLHIRLDDGYDSGGAYWGSGTPLWCITNGFDGTTFQWFTRAPSREGAIALFEAECPDIKLTWLRKDRA